MTFFSNYRPFTRHRLVSNPTGVVSGNVGPSTRRQKYETVDVLGEQDNQEKIDLQGKILPLNHPSFSPPTDSEYRDFFHEKRLKLPQSLLQMSESNRSVKFERCKIIFRSFRRPDSKKSKELKRISRAVILEREFMRPQNLETELKVAQISEEISPQGTAKEPEKISLSKKRSWFLIDCKNLFSTNSSCSRDLRSLAKPVFDKRKTIKDEVTQTVNDFDNDSLEIGFSVSQVGKTYLNKKKKRVFSLSFGKKVPSPRKRTKHRSKEPNVLKTLFIDIFICVFS